MLEETVHAGAEATVTWLAMKDPGLKELMDKMYGYAVFPAVGRASAVLGGAHGHGEVFEHGKPIGFATLNQLTLGVQVGGQTYSELVMFATKDALEAFKKSKISFSANASAVIVKAGATGSASPPTTIAKAYSRGGMLLELSLGGQKFTFKKHLGKDHKKGLAGGLAGLFKKRGEAGAHHDGEPRAEAQEAQEGEGGQEREGGGEEEVRQAAPDEGGEAPMETEGAETEGAERPEEEAEAAGAGEEQELEGAGEEQGEEAEASGADEEPDEEQEAAGAEEEELEEPGEEPEEQQAAPEEQQAAPEEPEEEPEERAASREEAEPEEPIEEPEPPLKPAKAAPPMTQKKSGAPARGTQPRRRA